ncbi:hypothetical protein AB1Y20_001646 [Prymnesium parvum]|uniref:DNA replication complex GINS protein SLD5 n=1 Tax=Prymnesium parvum TaxID=97485 RepID=A0AB34KBZ2_PRYPA
MNEKFAPEILQHKSDLVDTIQQLLETQAERITELSERDFLLRSIYEMERERVEYLLRVYLRTRLQKITKYAIHIGTSVEVQSRLSESERSFAQQYLELYKEHMDASIWNSADCEMLPAKLKDLSKMATLAVQPKTSSHVFARVMRDCEPFTLSDRAEEQVELKRGELVLLPYQPLANLISDGSVCLT